MQNVSATFDLRARILVVSRWHGAAVGAKEERKRENTKHTEHESKYIFVALIMQDSPYKQASNTRHERE